MAFLNGRGHRRVSGWVATAVFAACIVFGTSAAVAAPSDPVLGLAELQAKIDAAGGAPVDGYMKTVLKGDVISQIPVEIHAITSDDLGATNAARGLIVFNATGPEIARYGGIVAGMSGSPIYVEDGGVDKVVGALAYGNWFAKDGTGLATPIEAMIAIDQTYEAAATSNLPQPVAIDGQVVSKVVVTSDERLAKSWDTRGALVVKPYTQLSIGGLPPKSRGYTSLKKLLTRKGVDVLPLDAPIGLGKEGFSAPFEPGSSAAAMIARGDFWAGGIGTTTYTDGDRVLAFGHPFAWDGAAGYGFANAWIDYIWPSAETPFKVGRPGALRGTLTQDRGAAVLARTDRMPTEATITATVIDTGSGKVEHGTSYIPSWVINGTDWGFMVPSAAYSTVLRAVDDYWYVGSAVTTTTIVVRDGADVFSVTRRNVWDSTWDVAYESVMDIDQMIWEIENARTNGVCNADILAIDFRAELGSTRSRATITDVSAPRGIRIGKNPIRVKVYPHGQTTPVWLDTTLTVPKGGGIDGYLSVTPQGGWNEAEWVEEWSAPADDSELVDRRTTADVIQQLSDVSPNSEAAIRFSYFDRKTETEGSAVATVDAGAFMDGFAEKQTGMLEAQVSSRLVGYNGSVTISGIGEGTKDSTVSFYAKYPGETTDTLIGTTTLRMVEPGIGEFSKTFSGLKRNVEITAVLSGDRDTLEASKSFDIKVKAGVVLSSSAFKVGYGRAVTLTAKVLPASTGTVVFEYYRYGTWNRIAAKSLTASKASVSWKPPKGTFKTRARYLGGSQAAAGVSNSFYISAL